VDLAKYPLDEKFYFEGKSYEIGIHSLLEKIKHLSSVKKCKSRKLGS